MLTLVKINPQNKGRFNANVQARVWSHLRYEIEDNTVDIIDSNGDGIFLQIMRINYSHINTQDPPLMRRSNVY
jgi:hypothetical protein